MLEIIDVVATAFVVIVVGCVFLMILALAILVVLGDDREE